MLAATWPDAIKSDAKYHNDGPQGGDSPDGAEAARNTGYDDFNRHKYWHFEDIAFTQDGSDLATFPVPSPNAETHVGGNNVGFCGAGATKCTGELHALWDDILGTSNVVTSLAATSVYVLPLAAGNGPFQATAAYTADARKLAKRQVSLAGASPPVCKSC